MTDYTPENAWEIELTHALAARICRAVDALDWSDLIPAHIYVGETEHETLLISALREASEQIELGAYILGE